MSDVDGYQVVEVQATPLFHLRSAGGAEERPAHLGIRTCQKNGRQLLPEARLTVLKELIGLVDNQPLHAEQQRASLKRRATGNHQEVVRNCEAGYLLRLIPGGSWFRR